VQLLRHTTYIASPQNNIHPDKTGFNNVNHAASSEKRKYAYFGTHWNYRQSNQQNV